MKLKLKTKKKALWTRMRGGIKPRQRRVVKAKQTKRKKPIRKISKRQSARMRAYAAEARKWKEGRACFCGGALVVEEAAIGFKAVPVCSMEKHFCTDVHHKRGKVGALLMDKRFWIPLCRTAHQWVDANREKARRVGLLCQPGEWNKPVKEVA